MDINIAGAALRAISADGTNVLLSVTPQGPEPVITVDGRQVTGSINGQPAHMVTGAASTPAPASQAAVVPGVSGGSTAPNNSPVAGSPGEAVGSQYNMGRLSVQDGDVVQLPAAGASLYPTKENGAGELAIDCPMGAKFTLVSLVPAYAAGRGGHFSPRAPDGKDDLVIAMSITQGKQDAGVPAPTQFFPYNVDQPDEEGYSNLGTALPYCVNVTAVSGSFVLQNQLPR